MAKRSTISQNALPARLSPALSKEYNVRSMNLRRGDTVLLMRGIFKGVEGKITRLDYQTGSIYVEGVTKEQPDGNTIFVPIHHSKVFLTKLNLDDKWRKDILERRAYKPALKVAAKLRSRVKEREGEGGTSNEEEKLMREGAE